MRSRLFPLVLVLLIGLVGCSDDDNGGTAPPTTGTVQISPQPTGIAAPWSITGSDEYVHVGTVTFTGMYAGDEDPTPPPGFVYIPPGVFTMGSPEDEPRRGEGEGPQHQVTLTRGFFMSQYEVTEEWWYEVMGGDPTSSQLPKRYVSWDMAVQFCNALSTLEGLTPAYEIHGPFGDVTWDQSADGYRLPTEAEWEYACRAGSTTAFANGPITHTGCSPLDPNLDAMGWYCGNRTWEEGPAESGAASRRAAGPPAGTATTRAASLTSSGSVPRGRLSDGGTARHTRSGCIPESDVFAAPPMPTMRPRKRPRMRGIPESDV